MNYVSPEMASGMNYDEKSDNWAIGVLAYELLTGMSPFMGYNQQAILQKIRTHQISYPNFISETARNFIESLLTRDPSH